MYNYIYIDNDIKRFNLQGLIPYHIYNIINFQDINDVHYVLLKTNYKHKGIFQKDYGYITIILIEILFHIFQILIQIIILLSVLKTLYIILLILFMFFILIIHFIHVI